MPFDALFLTALSEELRPRALGCRVDKVQQPARDTVILALRGPGGGGRLLLTAAPNQPRIHFTDVPQENPAQPPMFCMLLRKHLVGGKLAAVTQPRMERLVDLAFDCTDEMGSPTQKHLILEIMGRNSNLILTDGEGRILDCLRRVDFEMSAERQVLPGLYYHQPPRQDKQEIFGQTPESVFALLQGWHEGQPFDKWLLDTFGGISPLVCREVTVQIFGALDAPYRPADGPLAGALADALDALERRAKIPQLLLREGKPWDFTCIPVTQYGETVGCETEETFSCLLDRFYGTRDQQERIAQKTQALRKNLTNLRNRTARKLENQRMELTKTHDREQLRRLGDIITANLHAISRGQPRLTAVDFYDPEMREITISLDPAISPQQNAAKYYKNYQKAKTAEKVLTEQIAKGETELSYLESVLGELARAESERDIAEIRQELAEGGYIRDTQGKKRMKLPASRPMRFRSTEGFVIWVGRNNRQNDQLTLKQAAKGDLWLHTQKIHGSHVIVETNGQQPSDETVTEAMMLAAYYSQARGGQNVPVDYTPVKFVKKPAGAKPGMVIYDRYQTGMVTPDEALVERLREESK